MDGHQNSVVTLPHAEQATNLPSSHKMKKVAHGQNTTCAPKIAVTKPSKSLREKPQESTNTANKQGLSWVAEPAWVQRRKELHEGECSNSASGKSSHSQKGQHHSTRKFRYSRKSPIMPAPALQPLVPGNTHWMGASFSVGSPATTDIWWAQVSNSLASLSARSYHLHIASGYLTCPTEELLLLYEAQKLNIDGKYVYDEVLRGLRERRLDWEFLRGSDGIAELRISWQMAAKREELDMVGISLQKRIYSMERKLQGHVETDFGDEGTVVDEPVTHDNSIKEDLMTTQPSVVEPPAETDTTAVKDDDEPVTSDNTPAASILPIQTTMGSTTPIIPRPNWADEVIEAGEIEPTLSDSRHIKNKTADEETQSTENSAPGTPKIESVISDEYALSPSLTSEVSSNVSDSTSARASSQTWAEVVADSVRSQNGMENWPDISGKSWAWERNWE